MNFNALVTAASAKLGRFGLKIQKHSPEILMAVSVATGVGAIIAASTATLKVNDILNDQKDTLETIQQVAKDKPEKYSEEDAEKDTRITHIQTAVKIAKLYMPAATLEGLSITSRLVSLKIMKKRNLALAAAYATVDAAFKTYRKRVTEKYGEDADTELRFDISSKKIDSVVTDPETGKEKKTKETVSVAGAEGDEYARYFDATCKGYEKDTNLNLTFLKLQEEYANQLLQARGHVFLNDIYDQLGIERTKMGQCVGWVKNNPNGTGDNHVDFRIKIVDREVDGYLEPAILLDFNVDGSILNLI